MMRKFTALLAAFVLAATIFAPVSADARDRRGHGGYYDRGDYRGHYGRRHHRDDDGDAVAAGVIGLVLGVAVGSMLAQPRDRQVHCYDNYRRCPSPEQGYYNRGYQDQGYYDPRYDDRSDSAYEREYGLEGGRYDEGSYDPYAEREPQCTRRERQWDRYADRYVTVDVAC